MIGTDSEPAFTHDPFDYIINLTPEEAKTRLEELLPSEDKEAQKRYAEAATAVAGSRASDEQIAFFGEASLLIERMNRGIDQPHYNAARLERFAHLGSAALA